MRTIAVVGAPADPAIVTARGRERQLLTEAGYEVTAAAPADLVLLEPGSSAAAVVGARAGGARLLLRVGDAAAAAAVVAEADALEGLLERPVTIVPEHALVRRRLANHCAGHRLSPADLGPMLAPAAAFAWPRPDDQMPPGLAALGGPADGFVGVTPASPAQAGLIALLAPPEPDGRGLRAALAAIERGAVLLAAPAWRALLGAAAIIGDAPALIAATAALATDRHRFLARRDAQFGAALARFGEDAWLERLLALVPPRDAAPPRRYRFARLLVGDFSRRDEMALAIALQLRAGAGSTGLLHLPDQRRKQQTINPLIDTCVRAGLATVVRPTVDLIEAETVDLHGGDALLAALELVRPRLVSATIRISPVDHRGLPEAVQERRRQRLARLYALPVETAAPAERLVALARSMPASPQPHGPNERLILGLVAFAHQPATAAVLALAAAGIPAVATIRLLLAGDEVGDWPELPGGGLEVIDTDGADPLRLLRAIDVLAVPTTDPAVCSLCLVALAKAWDLPVLRVPGTAIAGTDAPEQAALPLDQWAARLRRLRRRVRPAAPRSRFRPPAQTEQRVLFVTANGVGLGHLTRLAAIARRLPGALAPVFATMSQAVSVLQTMGYHAELLTSYAGQNQAPWNIWLARRVADLIDQHRPAAVVLDASNPYPGLLEAVLPRPDLPLVWIRRGMWRADQSNDAFLQRAPAFDLVIEPQDIADALDGGATATARAGVMGVPPIGLLDETDLFERHSARAALGLDPDRPAVLVQLGSGTTRDLVGLLDQVFRRLAAIPGLQVVNAEWLIAEDSLDCWPGVIRLHGFPIARYFKAFDFTISAAGYNSFNDILRFGLPAVFIANDAAMMDDQGARAACAEAAEAAFDIRADQLDALDDCVAALLNPEVRSFLSTNARQLARPNGAAAAASAIGRLVAQERVRS